jgi:hypothetical protein
LSRNALDSLARLKVYNLYGVVIKRSGEQPLASYVHAKVIHSPFDVRQGNRLDEPQGLFVLRSQSHEGREEKDR